jgi:hypothetical protein
VNPDAFVKKLSLFSFNCHVVITDQSHRRGPNMRQRHQLQQRIQ